MSLRNKIHLSLANKLNLVFFSLFVFTVGIIFLLVVPQLETGLPIRSSATWATTPPSTPRVICRR